MFVLSDRQFKTPKYSVSPHINEEDTFLFFANY